MVKKSEYLSLLLKKPDWRIKSSKLLPSFPTCFSALSTLDCATVMILEKKKEVLRIKVLNTKGETLLDMTV